MALLTLQYLTPGRTPITLPSTVTTFTYTVDGAGGGGGGVDAGSPGGPGGRGARIQGTITGIFEIYVGGGGGAGASGGGAAGGAGGTNGGNGGGGRGANSGPQGSSGAGGGGGAASYLVLNGTIIVAAGGGGGGGGGGNDGGPLQSFQIAGNATTSLSTSNTLASGANATNHPTDGGGGGAGGGGSGPGGAGFTPTVAGAGGGDTDAGGGSGGGNYYNNTSHTAAPSVSIAGGIGGGSSSSGSNGAITIVYDDTDDTPNPVANFATILNATRSTAYTTTNSVTVSGINVSVPAIANNSAIIVKNGASTGSSSTTVVNGDTLALTQTSSSSYSTLVSTNLTIGPTGRSVDAIFNIVTEDAPVNRPNSFDFVENVDAPLNTFITSNSVTITGLTATASVTATASAAGAPVTNITVVINGVDTGSNTGNISNGQTLALRLRTSNAVNTTTTASVVVGSGGAVDWNARTVVFEDTAPDLYNFTDITNAAASSVVTSNVQSISGINTSAQVSITAGFEVSINGGAFVTPTAATTISNGQTLQLRGTASAIPGASVTATVNIGNPVTGELADTWIITSGLAGDTTPDPFTFADRFNQLAAVLVYSNQVTPSGFTASSTLTVTRSGAYLAANPEVSVDGGTTWTALGVGSYTNTSFTPGMTIQLRATSSAYGSATSTLSITLGSYSTTWAIRTLSAAPVGANKSTWYNSTPGAKIDGYAIGTIITTFKDASGNFGTLDGSLSSRYPGFIECDGRLLNASEYPALFDILENTYGGTGSKVLAGGTWTYSGQFNIPKIRNRRLFGVGQVDGNSPASPAVPTRKGPAGTGAGSVNTVGSVGGDWYIATVDAAGTLPLEQVEGTPPSGTTGQFFALGTVTTIGYSSISGTVNFNVAGDIRASVGPLLGTFVDAPPHTHTIITGQSLSATTGLVPWGSRATVGNSGTISGTNSTASQFPGGPSFSPSNLSLADQTGSVTYNNFWSSPRDTTVQLDNSAPGLIIWMGALDTLQTTATTRVYSATGGTLTHTHYLSTTDFGNTSNIFSWGNVNGAGVKTGGMGGGNTVDVNFTHTEMGSRVNPGTFTLSSATAILPQVALRPNRTIPLIQPFFRVKYLIKAY